MLMELTGKEIFTMFSLTKSFWKSRNWVLREDFFKKVSGRRRLKKRIRGALFEKTAPLPPQKLLFKNEGYRFKNHLTKIFDCGILETLIPKIEQNRK